jgi:hypothetical protein
VTLIHESGPVGARVSKVIPLKYSPSFLEVWRTLWVESDHMRAPEDTQGPFGGNSDDEKATPTAPTMVTLRNLMRAANVEVKAIPVAYNTQSDDIPFKHYQNNAVTEGRNILSSRAFWAIRMLGAYEFSLATDNDEDGEVNQNGELSALLGWSANDNSVPNITNFVFTETTRDVYAMMGNNPNRIPFDQALDRVSAHEALHRFFGWHDVTVASNQGIMQGAGVVFTAPNFVLTHEQIMIIQQTKDPDPQPQ